MGRKLQKAGTVQQAEDASDMPLERTQLPQDESTPPTPTQDLATLNPDGRGRLRKQLEHFATLDDAEKHTAIKETWKEVAMGAALRAKAMVGSCSAKEFGLLQRVVIAGAAALDKGYPPEKKERDFTPQLVVNMFGSLGQRAAAIAMPPTPETLTIDAKEVTEWPDSATKTTPSLLTNTGTTTTTKLSTESSTPASPT